MDNIYFDIQQKINNLERRITVLEAQATRVKINKPSVAHAASGKSQKTEYLGPKGEILLLIGEEFFKTRKTLSDVCVILEKKECIYKKDVVRTALHRLSKPKEPLVKIQGGKETIYVKRK